MAEATLQAAEAQLESDREAVAVAEAAIHQAEAAVETARINLGYTKITAPISGRIGRSSVTEGAIVTAYQPVPLATIQQLDPIYVDVAQSTTELLRLKRRLVEGHLNHDGTNQGKVKLLMEDGTAYPLEGMLQKSAHAAWKPGPADCESQLREVEDAIEILSGSSGLRLGYRYRHDGWRRPGHL